jgi:hypothetical protein
MSEFHPNHAVMLTQKTDLLNSLSDEEIGLVKELVYMKSSLLNHLDATSCKIQTAIVVAVIVSG